MTVTWSDEIDAVLAGDLTVALGYLTPARGVVVQAVAPIGLRDRSAGTVGFTTSLGFSKKLERIASDPRVAMSYHAREHGAAEGQRYVLVQGRARVVAKPSEAERDRIRTQAALHLGPAREGWFWDRWLHEYYAVRVPVEVTADRLLAWPDLRCAGRAEVVGEPAPAPPDPQRPPRNGTVPRIDVARAARRLRRVDHTLLGYADANGYPLVVPVEVGEAGPAGLQLACAAELPPGGRRAGLLGHSYRPQLIGLETRQYTGWLELDERGRAVYAPHTETGYRAPSNKTLLLLLNGLLAKRGMRRAGRPSAH
jgi:nitroimidazol reductase NimA-like FMN-containing flavoprotein (pyridoxamine 5'-phosphate oxidase superfamily)